MPLKSSKVEMDSSGEGGKTCVLVLSEKANSVNQYKTLPKTIQSGSDQIKLLVDTGKTRNLSNEDSRKLKVTEQLNTSDGVNTCAPFLTSAPQDFTNCPPGIFNGYVHTMKSLKRLLEQYEENTSSKFILYTRSSGFGEGDWMKGKHRVTWEIAPNGKEGIYLPFQGLPFFIVGHAIYDCQYGRRRKPGKIKKKDTTSESPRKRETEQVKSMKIGCPAQILLREVILFPEYKLTIDTLKRRQKMSQQVRYSIQLHIEGKDMLQTERRIYIYFPRPSEHFHQIDKVNANSTISRSIEPVDPRIEKKIHSLVSEGLSGTKKIRQQVNNYVKEILPEGSPPPCNRRRYNPSDQDIRNTMKKARTKIKKARRKTLENDCSLLISSIREHLAAVKSEHYLMQLKDHLNHLNGLVKNGDSLEHLLQCSQLNEDNDQPSPKKMKEEGHSKEEKIIEEDQSALFPPGEHDSAGAVQSRSSDKPIELGPLIEIPAITGPQAFIYSNTYEGGESNQITYQEDLQNQTDQVEGVAQIYYFKKIQNQSDIYINSQDCSQVPYNITELIDDPLE